MYRCEIKQNGPFYGALLSRQSVQFTGGATNPQFHYDTSLRTARFSGVTAPYLVKKVTDL